LNTFIERELFRYPVKMSKDSLLLLAFYKSKRKKLNLPVILR
jgi:hypothetical protein